MKRSDVLAVLVFWSVVAGLIAARIAVGPTEVHRVDAGDTTVRPDGGKQSAMPDKAVADRWRLDPGSARPAIDGAGKFAQIPSVVG